MLDASNPFASPSSLPHGLPALDHITDGHILPAVHAGIAEQQREWEAIARQPDPPTLANTLEALESSGRLLSRVLPVHWLRAGCLSDDVVTAQDAEIGPALAAHSDALYLSVPLFRRVDDLHASLQAEGAAALGWDAEQERLVTQTHLAFVRAGAQLAEPDRVALRTMNQRLSTLQAAFRTLLLEGANAAAVHVTDVAQLEGLQPDAVATAAADARARDLSGWLLSMSLFSSQPALATLRRRDVRQRVHQASTSRGNGGPHDTRAVLAEIAQVRAARAELLGFADHASYAIADQTAGSVEAVRDLLEQLLDPAARQARAEVDQLTELLVADGEAGPLLAHDWPYYADRLRQESGVDTEALRAWFPLDQVLRDGVLHAATMLYGLTFRERTDLPVHHPDVTAFQVSDADGDAVGLFLLDPYARPSKRGGAWMSTLSDQSRLLDGDPVVTVTMNIPRPAGDAPALLSVDEITTLFHEFGHALHGLCSDVRYPQFSGTSVPRDFVEFPSQVNEMWAFDAQVLPRYARHHQTGEPLPDGAAAALAGVRATNPGFGTAEYLAAAVLDLTWHTQGSGSVPTAHDVEAFESSVMEAAGLADLPLAPRYRSTYFAHSFGGGYDARYYAYIWSEVLDAELVDWFTERGGLQAESGAIFRDRLLARGGAVDPMGAFAAVLGRAPSVQPLLQRRGLDGTG